MDKIDVTSMSSKGQVVIPLKMRARLGLREGARFAVLGEGDTIVLKKISMPSFADYKVMCEKAEKYAAEKGITPKDVKDAIKRARKK